MAVICMRNSLLPPQVYRRAQLAGVSVSRFGWDKGAVL